MKKFYCIIPLLLFAFVTFSQNNTVENLWKIYNARKYDSVISLTELLIKTDPNNKDFNLLLGRSYADKQEFNKAIPFLETVVKNDTNNSWKKHWGLLYLGNSYFMTQEYKDSKNSLEECINLNITKLATNIALNSFRLFGYDRFYDNWIIKESDNIRFHFQNLPGDKIEGFISSRDSAFKKINKFFRSSVPKKIDLFLWDSKEDLKNMIGTDIAFAKPEWCIVHLSYGQTPGHEITHVISHFSSTGIVKTGLINEGTAVFFDQTNQDREMFIKNWIKANNKNIDIMEIWTNWTKYPYEITYPLAGLFVKELINKFGKDKFLKFFKNQTYENAQLIFNEDIDPFIEEFENRVNE